MQHSIEDRDDQLIELGVASAETNGPPNGSVDGEGELISFGISND
ncbi:hypothetical protein FHS91_002502 [Sphingobium xanthum]|nr:hypothetical protein [Sphingobium xanthum]